MHFTKFLCLAIVISSAYVNCDINLKINFEQFTNQYGIKSNRKCCFENDVDSLTTSSICQRKCSTFFQICLLSNNTLSQENCIETSIIGENQIDEEQFVFISKSIKFQSIEKSGKQLLINVFNDESVDGQYMDKKRELISKWSINLPQFATVGLASKYEKFNQYLNQYLKISYKFECASGYSGENCSIVSCLNGCNLQNGGGYCHKPNECICNDGWSGMHCNINIKDANEATTCRLNCKNGGKCVFDKKLNKEYCNCDTNESGYTGELCEIKLVKACNQTFTCLHGGSCLKNGICLCSPGYTGDRCQIAATSNSKCGHNTCQNGGTCVINNDNQYECVCPSSYNGRFCEIVINTCIKKTPCLNGATCEWNPIYLTSKCVCSIGYSGLNCEVKANETPKQQYTQSPPKTVSNGFTTSEVMLVICLGVGLPILTILVILLICKVYSNRRINMKLQQLHIFTTTTSASLSSTSSNTEFIKNDEDDKCPKKELKLKDSTGCVEEFEVKKPQQQQQQSKTINFIENNLFSETESKKEKCVNEKKMNFAVNSTKTFVCENEIYLKYDDLIQQQQVFATNSKQKENFHTFASSVV